MRCTAIRLVQESRPGAMLRIRSVVIGSSQYRSEVGSLIPGYGKYFRGEIKQA